MASYPTTGTRSNSNSDDKNDEGYLFLIEFSHKHLDFQLPELISVLDMHGIGVDDTVTTSADKQAQKKQKQHKTVCRMLPLPNEDVYGKETKAAHRRAFVILQFSSDWYKTQQQQQLQQQQQQQKEDKESKHAHIADIQDIPSLLSRCVLVKRVIELWGLPGTTIEETAQNTKSWTHQSTLGKSIFDTTTKQTPEISWKLTIHTLGSKYHRDEQDGMRKKFSFLAFPGKVQMKDPAHEFILIREIELDTLGSPLYPRHGQLGKTQIIPAHDRRPPLACYFGRVLGMKEKMNQYDLNKRSYLGPTSMDAELSFVMSNVGQVKKSSVVLDPFVGTGSILVSCALRGAYCVGTDIDIRVLKGRSSDENIVSNFQQFKLPRPELIRSDNAIYHRHFSSHAEPWVDAIVTDPPYGIRAGARKSGTKKEIIPIPEEQRLDHIPQTKPYNVADVMADLLDVAARVLVMGGRLVYVIPSFATDFDLSCDLPQHDCLETMHISYQPFTVELGRRLVTMQKTKTYYPNQREAYMSKIWINGEASAAKCANIRDKINEAAKLKPNYEKKAAFRKGKRFETKQAKKRAKMERGGKVDRD